MWTLATLLPLLIGDKIPQEEPLWECYFYYFKSLSSVQLESLLLHQLLIFRLWLSSTVVNSSSAIQGKDSLLKCTTWYAFVDNCYSKLITRSQVQNNSAHAHRGLCTLLLWLSVNGEASNFHTSYKTCPVNSSMNW